MPTLQQNLARSGYLKIKDFWAPNEGSIPFRQWKMEDWFSEQIPREEVLNLTQLLESER